VTIVCSYPGWGLDDVLQERVEERPLSPRHRVRPRIFLRGSSGHDGLEGKAKPHQGRRIHPQ
jgi:hypothetical protein